MLSYVVMRLAYLLQWFHVSRTAARLSRNPYTGNIIVLTTISRRGSVSSFPCPLESCVPSSSPGLR